MEDGIETTRSTVEDGVSVRKAVETDAEGTATVTLEVTAERKAPATVRITEPVLEAVPREGIELHADRGAEHWQVDEAAFEREFAAGESYTAVYRVADLDPDRFEAVDSGPAVEVIDAAGDADSVLGGVADRNASDAVRELIGGERDSLAAADGPGSGASDVELSLEEHAPGDSAAEGTAASTVASEPARDGARPEAPASSSPDADGARSPGGATGVARALLEELREGRVDEETAAELRSELQPGRSQDLRIRHLQNRVSDLAAYTEMLEAFVDDRGTLEAAFEAVESDVSALDDEVGAVRSDLEGLSATDDDVDALEAAVDELRDGQADLRTGQEDFAARLERLETELEAVDDRLEDFEEFQTRLSDAF